MKDKRTTLIGCMIRPGQPRGGMAQPHREGPRHGKDKYANQHRQIIEAANEVLERRGVWVRPTSFGDGVSQAVVERRAEG